MSALSEQLRNETCAVTFRSQRFGVNRRLDDAATKQAAKPFQAEPAVIRASKCLLDTSAEPFRACTEVLSRARRYWKSMTVFYPVKGVRLMRRDLIESFEEQMQRFETELETNVTALVQSYKGLKDKAKQQLGQLFKPSDYPEPDTLADEFQLDWGFPSIEPPNYLKELNPRLFAQEQARVAARFEEAMASAEQALAAEMQDLLGHLAEKLSATDGKKRKLSDKALDGLTEFVEKFRQISVRTTPELDAMIKQVEQITKGVDLATLKQAPDQQQNLFTTVSTLKEQLDSMVVEAPVRLFDLEDEE